VSKISPARRLAFLSQLGFKCDFCDDRSQPNLHHRHYRTQGHELPSDLRVLCPRHHGILHAIMNWVYGQVTGGGEMMDREMVERYAKARGVWPLTEDEQERVMNSYNRQMREICGPQVPQ